MAGRVTIRDVPPGSAAADAGLRPGDIVVHARSLLTGHAVDLSSPPADATEAMRQWREAYRLGTRGPLEVGVRHADGSAAQVRVERPPAWALPWTTSLGAVAVQLGPIVEMVSIVGAAVVLLLLRPRGATALLIVSTLACAGTSTGGSLLGGELGLPPFLSAPLTVFAWMAMPVTFPLIAMAILYLPGKSGVLVRHPWLHAVPVIVALPMVIPAVGTALFLAGADGMLEFAAWDASHPDVFYASFGGGLLLNIAAMVEGVWRYKHNPDLLERRRVAVATCTLVLATVAFTDQGRRAGRLRNGRRLGGPPWWLNLAMHLLMALAGAGITYTVAVHRVLAPRVVVRQSLQYALARKTLGLCRRPSGNAAGRVAGRTARPQPQRDRLGPAAVLCRAPAPGHRRAQVPGSRARVARSPFLPAGVRRTRAVVVAVGSHPVQTDPNELTALVVQQIDAALHPTMVAVLVAGVEPGTLVPVSVLHGTADTLDQRGGIGTMLTWSDTPLDLDLADERSAAGRLPPDEVEWLRCTGAVLFVPLSATESGTRQLLGALVLGGKRSEEPSSADDRALLSSIGAQVSLGLDVARLRRRQSVVADGARPTTLPTNLPSGADATGAWLVAECQVCGTCHDSDVPTCSKDGSALRRGRLPRVVDAKYRVDRVLGRGGMGAVYCAHDMRLERDVAIKVVRAELLSDPDARTRFRREAQLVARLQHPGIVSVFDYGTLPDGAAFLVMEYVRGRDLRAVLRADGPMAPDRVTRLLRAIAAPVEAAHALGVLHRDLKPENILLPEGDVGAKVLDFGVAKLLGSDGTAPENETLTLAGQPIGTPAYMAPEQLAGASVSTRTDVFALGAIAYELLTGTPPFGRGPLVEIATRHRTGPGPIEREDVSPTMADAITRALSVDVAVRPASATAFALSLGG